ncbi:MAG: NapC/NirT family cytochrome c [candidate division KSB1 bacterium]
MDFSNQSGRKLPSSFYNLISMIGAGIAAISFGAILFLFFIDAFAGTSTPYLGIINYIVFPVFLILGLLLVPIGMWREHRRRAKSDALPSLPRVDLNIPHHRRMTLITVTVLTVFLLFSGVGSYHAYEFTESTEFCGKTCHTVMEPEYVAYQNSPHARVTCAGCHVGSGAGWYVQSKLAGAYQVYSVLFKKYSQPIPTPIDNLRPARETCEQCHWPQAFFGNKQDTRVHFMKDEANTRWAYNLLIKIGGGNPEEGHTSGIHWHMNISNKIEYFAADEARESIPWVRSTNAKGEVTVYSSDPELLTNTVDPLKLRRMDCIDCHNRPAHIFSAPNISLNKIMNNGLIDMALPSIKATAVEALTPEYETKAAALAAIDSTIHAFYQNGYPEVAAEKQKQIAAAVAYVQDIYSKNNFPYMKSNWRAYPDHIGHYLSPGCYRCHDGKHQTAEGKVLTNDCNTCHLIIEQGDGATVNESSLQGLEFKHPIDIGEAWKETSCHECHGAAAGG